MIEQLFADRAGPGFYVDVGAFHRYSASNTYLPYRCGWRGINIEPDPALCAEIRKHRPRAQLADCRRRYDRYC